MAKKTQIQIGLMPGQVRQLLALGKEEFWQTTTGALQKGKIVAKVVLFILQLRHKEYVENYLKKKGGTLTGLIDMAVKDYCKPSPPLPKHRG